MSASVPRQDESVEPVQTVGRRRWSWRFAGSALFWGMIVAVGLLVPIVTRVWRPAPQPLPVLGTLPAFTLVDQEGRPSGSADLRGHVWVASFIFTRCPTICPVIVSTLGRIQHRARGIEHGFRIVSFSVDPQYDTPERLAAYASQHRASPRMWKFLTGPLGSVQETVVGGLKIAMGDIDGQQDFASIMHGTHFVLVDQQGRIRGYYDSSAADVVDRVLADAAMLVNRGD
jgi:protein SCO1